MQTTDLIDLSDKAYVWEKLDSFYHQNATSVRNFENVNIDFFGWCSRYFCYYKLVVRFFLSCFTTFNNLVYVFGQTFPCEPILDSSSRFVNASIEVNFFVVELIKDRLCLVFLQCNDKLSTLCRFQTTLRELLSRDCYRYNMYWKSITLLIVEINILAYTISWFDGKVTIEYGSRRTVLLE